MQINNVGLIIRVDHRFLIGVYDGIIMGRIREFKQIPLGNIHEDNDILKMPENVVIVANVQVTGPQDFNAQPIFSIPLNKNIKEVVENKTLFMLTQDLYIKFIRPELDRRFPNQLRVELPFVLN